MEEGSDLIVSSGVYVRGERQKERKKERKTERETVKDR